MTKDRKKTIVKEYGKSEKDTGNSEVQIALLTEQITILTEHAKVHGKDHHSRQGLLKAVSQRKAMLDFLKDQDVNKYRVLIKKLNIRK